MSLTVFCIRSIKTGIPGYHLVEITHIIGHQTDIVLWLYIWCNPKHRGGYVLKDFIRGKSRKTMILISLWYFTGVFAWYCYGKSTHIRSRASQTRTIFSSGIFVVAKKLIFWYYRCLATWIFLFPRLGFTIRKYIMRRVIWLCNSVCRANCGKRLPPF